MSDFTPIRVANSGGPGDFILPVALAYHSASNPTLAKFWQWVPAQSGTTVGYWALVTAIGEGK